MALFIALWAAASPLLCAQYFDRMSVEQRDSVLVALSVEVAVKYEKEGYVDYESPVIKYVEVNKNEEDIWGRGQSYYVVTFPYNTLPTTFKRKRDYAAMVILSADTGRPSHIHLANEKSHIIDRQLVSPTGPRWEVGYIYFDESDPEIFSALVWNTYVTRKKYTKFWKNTQDDCGFLVYTKEFLYTKNRGHTRDTLPVSVLDKISFLDDNFINKYGRSWSPGNLFRTLYIIERYSQDSVIRSQVVWRYTEY